MRWFLIVFVLLFFSIWGGVHAADPAVPQEVKVGVYVLNIGKFDVATGSYVVDFYLNFDCPIDCSVVDFEFLNGRATSIDKIIDTPTNRFYRVQANLASNVDLKDYPFDSHSLTIEIEEKSNSINRVVFVPDVEQSGIDPAVIFVGWDLKGWDSISETHEYAVYDETFSRYIFFIHIERIALASLLKIFLPILFIMIISMLAIFIGTDKIGNRFGLNTSALLSAVFFHLNITSSIPPTGYLTFADKFMIVAYISLGLNLLATVLLMRHTDAKDHVSAERIYRAALYGLPSVTIALSLLVFLFK